MEMRYYNAGTAEAAVISHRPVLPKYYYLNATFPPGNGITTGSRSDPAAEYLPSAPHIPFLPDQQSVLYCTVLQTDSAGQALLSMVFLLTKSKTHYDESF